MTPELIIQLIAALLGTGGFITLFLIIEKKAAAQVANTEKVNEQWQLIVAQKERDFSTLSQKYEAATEKIDKLYDVNTELRKQIDVANTNFAVSKLMRCHVTKCINRVPPFGSTEEVKQILDGEQRI
ncbi:MAG TPA: hypothetical protein PLQ69_06295 [Paludibacter sp.]|nr:hypothetical protein [Paludibacter sp.]HPM10307.1 hypothetical protein [Paludibacter sp.]